MDYKIEKSAILSEWIYDYNWVVIIPVGFTSIRHWFSTKEDAEMWILEMMLE